MSYDLITQRVGKSTKTKIKNELVVQVPILKVSL